VKSRGTTTFARIACATVLAAQVLVARAPAQGVPLTRDQLNQLVSRIALYPDPLLAQVLTAATYPDQIPDAAAWADDHSDLHQDSLSQAMTDDSVPWDASVLALLPFPSVLDMMSQDTAWTRQLGDAVLSERPDVMDAVQRMRYQAHEHGYLGSGGGVRVVYAPGAIAILPLRTGFMYVPVYDPAVVFVAPVGPVALGAVVWGPPLFIAPGFMRFGWEGAGFGWGAGLGWRTHTLLIDRRAWGRTLVNRTTYAHPYARPYVQPRAGARVERHQVRRRH
jgi:Protein of unknown function (DUF3300)